MRERLKRLFKNQNHVRHLLFASIGFNLVLGSLIAVKCFSLELPAESDATMSYQDILSNWRPFASEEPKPEKEEGSSETMESDSTTPSTEEGKALESLPVTPDSPDSTEEKPDSSVEAPPEEDLEVETPSATEEPVEENGFSIHPISETLQQTLEELAPLNPSVITYDDLRLVKVLYWGFDNQTHMGELIVNQAVATEVMAIFEEVYAVHYPIEKIRLISEYQNSDEDSMHDNNTSGFNYRVVTNGSEFSMHAYGLAIDVNPKMNPYVSEDYVLPANAMAYVDRDQNIPGMIQAGDALHQAFTSRGWEWGGDWTSLKDYQHFSKSID